MMSPQVTDAEAMYNALVMTVRIGLILLAVLVLYPLVALGRIWYYAKQQLREMKEIRALLEGAQSGGESGPRFTLPR